MRLAAPAFAFALLALLHAAAAPAAPAIPGVDPAYIDPAADPCTDFYAYANGAFASVPIPGEYSSYGVNEEIDQRNFALLHDILESSARTPGAPGTVTRRIGDFYAAGMDEAAIEKDGLTPIAPLLEAIDQLTDPATELLPLLGRLHALGLDPGFYFYVQVDDRDSSAMIAKFEQGGLGLPERDYYFRADAESAALRADYTTHIARLLQLAGTPEADASAQAATILALETKLAHASRTLADLRDPAANYHKIPRARLAADVAPLPWETFLAAADCPASEATFLVGQPAFFQALADLLAHEPADHWRAYLRWHLLHDASPCLARPFADETFAFYGHRLSGTTEQRPRWKRVLAATDDALGEDLGQLFVARAFSPAAKARVESMVHFHLQAMRGRIEAATWMSPATKKAALAKIDRMHSKIGYPDHWRDYSALTITRASYLANVLAASAFEFHRQLAKLGQPVDRTEWGMTPQTNNAYYDDSLNEMVLPAGILQPPFFDETADDASNYGGLASTIGHELTHGFDDQGRQYDAAGNLHDWWTADDAARFEQLSRHIVDQYDGYEIEPGLHIHGDQSLGENIADIGGLRVSYEAWKLATAGQPRELIGGFTPEQRFFIAFAQSWRENQRPEVVRLYVQSDVHSPARWRVLGPVADFPEFRAAFGCPPPKKPWPPIW